MKKREAFEKIYKAMRDSQTGLFKHNFLTEEDEQLPDHEMLEKIDAYAKKYDSDSRTAKAWALAKQQQHYDHCNKMNMELIKEIHQVSFEGSFFSRSYLNKLSVHLSQLPSYPIVSPINLKTEWDRKIKNPKLAEDVDTYAKANPNSRTAVIRKILG